MKSGYLIGVSFLGINAFDKARRHFFELRTCNSAHLCLVFALFPFGIRMKSRCDWLLLSRSVIRWTCWTRHMNCYFVMATIIVFDFLHCVQDLPVSSHANNKCVLCRLHLVHQGIYHLVRFAFVKRNGVQFDRSMTYVSQYLNVFSNRRFNILGWNYNSAASLSLSFICSDFSSLWCHANINCFHNIQTIGLVFLTALFWANNHASHAVNPEGHISFGKWFYI